MQNEKGFFKTYRYEIKPNSIQKAFINHHFGCSRLVYNKLLASAETVRIRREEEYKNFLDNNPILKEEVKKKKEAINSGKKYVKPQNLPKFKFEGPNIASQFAYNGKELPSIKSLRNEVYSLNEETGEVNYFLKEISSKSLSYISLAVANAYSNYFDFNKPNARAPRFKSKYDSVQSFTTNPAKHKFGDLMLSDLKFDEKTNKILLPKFNSKWASYGNAIPGWIKVIVHTPFILKDNPCYISKCTISQDTDEKYFISMLVYYEKNPNKVNKEDNKTSCGVTFAVSDAIAVTSDGEKEKFYYNVDKEKLSSIDKHISDLKAKLALKEGPKNKNGNKIHPSNNYVKLRKKIRKLEAHKRRIKEYNTHCISRDIVNSYSNIYLRDYDAKGNIQGNKAKNVDNTNEQMANINKMSTDARIGTLINQIKYKAIDDNKEVHLISKYFPCNQICSNCGEQVKEHRDNNEYWTCPICHAKHKRLVNAAINILNEGQQIKDWEDYEKQKKNQKLYTQRIINSTIERIWKLREAYNKEHPDEEIKINKGKVNSVAIELSKKEDITDEEIIEFIKKMVSSKKRKFATKVKNKG